MTSVAEESCIAKEPAPAACDKASIKEPYVNRGDCCLDTGCYLLNLRGCARCGARYVVTHDRKTESQEDEDEGVYEEMTTFVHMCGKCGYTIAEHEHCFSVNKTMQNFSMICMLCGTGSDERRLSMSSEEEGDVHEEEETEERSVTNTGRNFAASRSMEGAYTRRFDARDQISSQAPERYPTTSSHMLFRAASLQSRHAPSFDDSDDNDLDWN